MDCFRCHGMMVSERFNDQQATLTHRCFESWRCLCCGASANPVILHHQFGPLARPTDLSVGARLHRRSGPTLKPNPVASTTDAMTYARAS